MTSDGLEQIIIRGQGCGLISARELQEEIKLSMQAVQQDFARKQDAGKQYLGDAIAEQVPELQKEGLPG